MVGHRRNLLALPVALVLLLGVGADLVCAQVAIRGERIFTMAGPAIDNGVIVIRDGKISAIGAQRDVPIPKDYRVLDAKIVTPGLIDAHSVVGLGGIYNQDPGDQDQLERSSPIQPELRALDAFNVQEPLVAWIRSFGVTTVHTGHAPGELISGQSLICKTHGNTVDDAVMVPSAALTVTLAESAKKKGKSSPGTRGKMMALLRAELIKAQEYLTKRAHSDVTKRPERNLRLEALGRALKREIAFLVTAHRAQDIANALRLAREFKLRLWLDGAAESYLLVDEIKRSGAPVILHATMKRSNGETENLSFETASKLQKAGIKVALQSGYESYVPKTRVVLFEAGIAAANGMGFEGALATITRDAAKILGIDKRVGTLAVGKDGDVALYDGDPFEYTSHCIGTVIAGKVVSEKVR